MPVSRCSVTRGCAASVSSARSIRSRPRSPSCPAEPFFSDVLTGVGRRNSLSRFEGLPASDLDAPQKKLLFALVDEYVRNADFDAAERHLDAIQRAGLDRLHFSWRGPTDDARSPFYYRIHGPRLIIEFAVQEPNHIHTII